MFVLVLYVKEVLSNIIFFLYTNGHYFLGTVYWQRALRAQIRIFFQNVWIRYNNASPDPLNCTSKDALSPGIIAKNSIFSFFA